MGDGALLRRRRLDSRLSSGATIISGSSGSGKSLTLAHFAEAERRKGRRVRWGAGDGAGTDAATVIVDDLNPHDATASMLLARAVETLTSESTLIIATRFPAADVIAVHPWLGAASIIDAKAMAFTEEEIAGLLESRGVAADRTDAMAIMQATGGTAWLVDACVHRLEEYREIETTRVPGSVSALHARIFDDVVNAAVEARVRSTTAKHDVVRSALRSSFVAAQTDELFTSVEALPVLTAEGWFDHLSGGRVQLPAAVRTVVRRIGARDHHAALEPLAASVAAELREAGDLLGAWQVAWEAKDDQACWAVVKAAGAVLDVTAMWRSCMDMRSQPWPEVTSRPELYIWSLAFRIGDSDDARSRAEAAEMLPLIASPEGREGTEQLWVRGLAAARVRWGGDLPAAVAEARRVRSLWAALRPRVPRNRRGVGVLALYNVGVTLSLASRWGEALGCFVEAAHLAEHMGAMDVAAVYTANEAMVRAFLGDISGAALAVQRARDLAPGMDERLLDTAYYVAKAIVSLESGSPAAAADAISMARASAQAAELWPVVEGVGVIIDVLNGARVTLSDFEQILATGRERGHAPLTPAVMDWIAQFLRMCAGGSPDPGVSPLPDGDPFLLGALDPLLAGDTARAMRALRGQELIDSAGARTQMSRALFTAAGALSSGDDTVLAPALSSCASVFRVSRVATPVRMLPPSVRMELAIAARRHGHEELADLVEDMLRHPSVAQLGNRAPALTPREHRVLEALADDGSVKAMAASLGVSPNTVKTQLRAIYRKLGASSRSDVLSKAVAWGLLG